MDYKGGTTDDQSEGLQVLGVGEPWPIYLEGMEEGATTSALFPFALWSFALVPFALSRHLLYTSFALYVICSMTLKYGIYLRKIRKF